MKRILSIAALCLLGLGCASCGGSSSEKAQTPAAPAAPVIPDAIQKAAEDDLGSESEVLVYGDLAKTGATQALVVNRLKTTPPGTVPGILVSRAAVIENDGGHWKEILRCDEHLENPKGFLGGIPLAAVGAWRIQYEQNAERGLQLYFTPLARPQGGYVQTLGVRWNPEVRRYETLDRNYEHFLSEVPALETPESRRPL